LVGGGVKGIKKAELCMYNYNKRNKKPFSFEAKKLPQIGSFGSSVRPS
jgi:hypothetical protein